MIRAIAKILKVLNSESNPGQISLAVCLSMVAGLTPLMSPHNLIVIFLALILRVNLSAFILGLGLFTGFAYALDPMFDRLGLAVLTAESLKGLWTALYNSTIWRLEHFNNTIVMGSLLVSLVLFAPAYLVLNRLIFSYREHVLEYVKKTRIMQFFLGSKLYHAYKSVSGWGGGA